MRSALIGVLYAHDPPRLRALVRASTRLTHTDPRAETGALLVALAAGTPGDAAAFLEEGSCVVADDAAWQPLIASLAASLQRDESTAEYAKSLGLERGVTGYMLHTVPIALHAALSTCSVRDAVIAAVECGGDSDTVGAIAGAISGARHGPSTIPAEWLDGWSDFPITVRYMDDLGHRLTALSNNEPTSAPSFPWWLALLRNVLFLGVVLLHVLRRMLPPY